MDEKQDQHATNPPGMLAVPTANKAATPEITATPALLPVPPTSVVSTIRYVATGISPVQDDTKNQQKTPGAKSLAVEGKEAAIRITTKPPSQDELFRLETEEELRARLLQEAKQAGVKLEMTEFTTPSRQPLPQQRDLPEQTSTFLGNRLCYGRLFFEQPASERFGQSLPVVQPLISAGIFYCDLALWPIKLAVFPLRPLECNDADADFVWDRVASPRRPWWLW